MTVFTKLHQELEIPNEYYRASTPQGVGHGWNKKEPPPLGKTKYDCAIQKLRHANIIKGDSTDNLLAAICERFMKADKGQKKEKPMRIRPASFKVLDIILENQRDDVSILAKRAGCGERHIMNAIVYLQRTGQL